MRNYAIEQVRKILARAEKLNNVHDRLMVWDELGCAVAYERERLVCKAAEALDDQAELRLPRRKV